MKRHWQYLKYVMKHKWYVFLACLQLGVPLWIAIFHDWDKFLPDEWFAYARFFYNEDGSKRQRRDKTGYYKPTDTGNDAFERAWFLHARRNKHHWQYWALATDEGLKLYPMPDVYVREMLADWRGAGRAQGTPDTLHWYVNNYYKMHLHRETRLKIERYLIHGDFDCKPNTMTLGEHAELHNSYVQPDTADAYRRMAKTENDAMRTAPRMRLTKVDSDGTRTLVVDKVCPESDPLTDPPVND